MEYHQIVNPTSPAQSTVQKPGTPLRVPTLEYECKMRREEEILRNSIDPDKLRKLRATDGYEEWRQKEVKEINGLIMTRLLALQNPKDCAKAKKLVCHLDSCGFGCMVQRLKHCMMASYKTNRTVMLESSKVSLYGNLTFNKIFRPLSKTCTSASGTFAKEWQVKNNQESSSVPVIHKDMTKSGINISRITYPRDLKRRIQRVFAEPAIWFYSFFLGLLQFRPSVKRMIANEVTAFKASTEGSPIVGVHIRRTDKLIKEAKAFSVRKYMRRVEEYYRRLEKEEGRVLQRRVFVATDEEKVLDIVVKKYPNYEVLFNRTLTTAGNVQNRYSKIGLESILREIHILVNCDYVVCTLSSNVCRLVYEMKVNHDPTRKPMIYSLDTDFYEGTNLKKPKDLC